MVLFGCSSELSSAKHAFMCSICRTDGPPEKLYQSRLMYPYLFSSSSTMTSMEKVSTATRKFSHGEVTCWYRSTCSVVILAMLNLASGLDLLLAYFSGIPSSLLKSIPPLLSFSFIHNAFNLTQIFIILSFFLTMCELDPDS